MMIAGLVECICHGTCPKSCIACLLTMLLVASERDERIHGSVNVCALILGPYDEIKTDLGDPLVLMFQVPRTHQSWNVQKEDWRVNLDLGPLATLMLKVSAAPDGCLKSTPKPRASRDDGACLESADEYIRRHVFRAPARFLECNASIEVDLLCQSVAANVPCK
mgnify:CR=1 FL=1